MNHFNDAHACFSSSVLGIKTPRTGAVFLQCGVRGIIFGNLFSAVDEFQLFGELYPFVPAGYLDSASRELAQDVGAVVAYDEFGIEVFRTIVVDHLQSGFLAVFADINACHNPYAGVGRLLQITISVAENILSGDGDGFFVQIQAQEYIIFLIGNNALKRPVRLLLRRCGANENQNENENAYATKD